MTSRPGRHLCSSARRPRQATASWSMGPDVGNGCFVAPAADDLRQFLELLER
ncbi:hypothetical protein [Streptomyces sp. NPDC047061]|uniref:hypothetical protein n=1 Tax=Streptomyces sp. NPDC047061 TaxID=3154605 RepID=UPI00340576BC